MGAGNDRDPFDGQALDELDSGQSSIATALFMTMVIILILALFVWAFVNLNPLLSDFIPENQHAPAEVAPTPTPGNPEAGLVY